MTPVLAGILEKDFEKMWEFDKFFQVIRNIVKMKVGLIVTTTLLNGSCYSTRFPVTGSRRLLCAALFFAQSVSAT